MEQPAALKTPIFDLVLCLAQAVDLVSPLVANHHVRAAQIAFGLGTQLGLPEEDLRDLVIAAALHDVGGLTRQDRLTALDFEYNDPYGHAICGYLLLQSFSPFQRAAEIVRFHHVPWQEGAGLFFGGLPVPEASHLLHLADRVAVLLDPSGDILSQSGEILSKIRSQSGSRFAPRHVAALEALAGVESFWFDASLMKTLFTLNRRLHWQTLEISQDEFLGLTHLFRRIIDFRSPFTASHSAGVAAVSEALGRVNGLSSSDCRMLHLAGLLHDLGKLAVPAEILEKPGKLTPEETNVMRRHTYYTYHILEPLEMLDIVRVWGAYHHERMDGRGYPFHLGPRELPLGARIVSVADVFTALTEDRPYRAGFPSTQALEILRDDSAHHRLDDQIIQRVGEQLSEIDQARRAAQAAAREEYRQFIERVHRLTPLVTAS